MQYASRAILISLIVCSTGCSKPFAASSNLRLTSDEEQQVRILSQAQTREAISAMQLVTEGHVRTAHVARPAMLDVRWSDVPLAARYASAEMDVAVVRMQHLTDNEIRFVLLTLDERPGKLIVRRVHDQRVYEATASFGRFGDDVERATGLVTALHRNMKALGQKRAFE